MASINATTSSGIVATADNTGTLQLQTAGTNAINIDASQRAAFVAGTAALPAITTSGDTNTGMFFPAADTIAFAEGGTESMRLDSNGTLIVGDTVQSGSSKLTLKQSVDATNGGLAFVATDGNGAVISRLTDGGFTFRNGGVERMRITSAGQVLINSTTAPIGAAPMALKNGTINWSMGPNGNGNFILYNDSAIGLYLVNGGTSWTGTSDERVKTDLKPIENAAEKVSTLRSVTGRFKTDDKNKSRAFLIAQDVQKVLPEAVYVQDDEQGTLGLAYTDVIPLLTAAIQEQQAIINDLKARIEVLEAK